MAVICHLGFLNFENVFIRPLGLLLAELQPHTKFCEKLDNSLPRLPSCSQKRSFPVWRPSAILSLKIWILVKTFYNGNYLTQLTKIFIIIGWFSLRYVDFHISSRPPSCICIDAIIASSYRLRGPDIVLNYHIDWFICFHEQASHMRDWRQRDRQTDTVNTASPLHTSWTSRMIHQS